MAPLGLPTLTPASLVAGGMGGTGTNVVVVSKIPEGLTEQMLGASAGRFGEVLQVTFQPADVDGPGWAMIAFATHDLAKLSLERLNGKPIIPGNPNVLLDAVLGEGTYGPIRQVDDRNSAWKEARTPQGEVYYYHAVTRQTSWTKPQEFQNAVPPPPGGPPNTFVPGQGIKGQPPPPPGAPPGRPQAFAPGGTFGAPAPPPVQPVQGAQALAAASQAISAAAQKAEDSAGATMGNAGPVGANLFVYHIPNSWDDNILKAHFEPFGDLISCRVTKDAEGRPRGFGFCSFNDPGSAAAAIAGMHGFPVDGKWLKVQLKKGDEQQMDQSLVPTLGAPAPPPPGAATILPGAPPPPPGAPSGYNAVMGAGMPARPAPY